MFWVFHRHVRFSAIDRTRISAQVTAHAFQREWPLIRSTAHNVGREYLFANANRTIGCYFSSDRIWPETVLEKVVVDARQLLLLTRLTSCLLLHLSCWLPAAGSQLTLPTRKHAARRHYVQLLQHHEYTEETTSHSTNTTCHVVQIPTTLYMLINEHYTDALCCAILGSNHLSHARSMWQTDNRNRRMTATLHSIFTGDRRAGTCIFTT